VAEREAQTRKRAAQVGFEVGLLLEVAGTDLASAKALLWRLIGFADAIGDGRQAITWAIRRGALAAPSRLSLGDWELAKLWQLPDASFFSTRPACRGSLKGSISPIRGLRHR